MLKVVFLLQLAFIVMGAVFVLTQVVLPALRNRPFFPILRKRVVAAENELVQSYEDQDVAQTKTRVRANQPQKKSNPE